MIYSKAMFRKNIMIMAILTVLVATLGSCLGFGDSIKTVTATKIGRESLPGALFTLNSTDGNGENPTLNLQATMAVPASSSSSMALFLPITVNQSQPTLPLSTCVQGLTDTQSDFTQTPATLEASNSWSMAAANPARTSWVPDEVSDSLDVWWYRPFEAYIPYRVQIVAAYDSLFISTSKGLYALDPSSGSEKWVYSTEMPLGHSPTASGGILYVGGFDRYLHAINASTGKGIWKFQAGAGFDTNPLVVNGIVYAGNRDGCFYAINANNGQLVWQYPTQGPIHYSAAYSDGVVYFASDDGHAYALNAQDGNLVWKSEHLPGAGFHSWWPVVAGDYVIFSGSSGYRVGSDLGPGTLTDLDEESVYPNRATNPQGTLVGPIGKQPGNWVAGTPTIDASKSEGGSMPITEYFEKYPWRRTYFVLNKATGTEYTTDFDGDGKPEYAPILWFGTKGQGNRYPPILGSDGVLYQTNSYMSDPSIPGGQVSGWQIGTPYLSVVTSDWGAVDEPHAYSAGGDRIFWNLCCDRQSGSFDITIPNEYFYDQYLAGDLPPTGGNTGGREDNYSEFKSLPGYNVRYYGGPESVYASYGSKNGVYGYHGDQAPPIPYNGMLFMQRSNAVIAFGPSKGAPQALPMVSANSPDDNLPAFSVEQLKEKLAAEVKKILSAGHLKPGYMSTGIFDVRSKFTCGDYLIDYWHHPADIQYFLLRSLPYLTPDLQQQTKNYLKSEFQSFPPYQYNHIGWKSGTLREWLILPPEITLSMAAYSPQTKNNNFAGWNFAPQSFYSLWKYAQVFGGAKSIFDAAANKLEAPPLEAVLQEMPQVHNAFIAGYIGYLELQKLAGYPESSDVKATLEDLKASRVANFTLETSDEFFSGSSSKYYCRTLNVSRNFMYLVPELAEYLRTSSANSEIQAAIDEYELLAPYWFVSKAEMAFAEGIFVPLYDMHALFQAKAMISLESRTELSKYIDVPAMPVGDLFYIDNLVAAIEASAP